MGADSVGGEPEWLRLAQVLAEEIRRRRKAAGLSQPRLAARIGYTAAYVSMAERPRKGLASAALVQAIDTALGGEGVLVALHEQVDAARRACRAGLGASTVEEDTSTTGGGPGQAPDPEEVEKAKRRELITSAAAIAFGAGLDEPVRRILAAADEPQVPSRARTGDLIHLRRAIEALRASGRRTGGVPVRHHALAALRWATALLESSCTPAVRREIAATTADLAGLAACYSRDAGFPDPARRLSLLGLRAARESGDLGMRACVASDCARQEIREGNWSGGLELVQLALTADDALTPNAIADLYTVKALAYACKQDDSGCRRYLAAAVDTYRPDSVSADPPWLSYLSPDVLYGELANAKYDLLLWSADGGQGTAERTALVESLSIVLRHIPADLARYKAIIATRLATLLYQEGEQRVAHQTAQDAVTLAGQVRSARLADDLRVLLHVVPAGARADEHTVDLRQRLSTVLAEMT